MLLAEVQCHPVFRAWPRALPALASAALMRRACSAASSTPAALLRQWLHLSGQPMAGLAVDAGQPRPQPLRLGLEVPLAWLAEQATALEIRTARLQAQPASQQEIDAVQQQLVAVLCGEGRTYCGYKWTPSLALFVRINSPPPLVFGAPAFGAQGGAAPAAAPAAGAGAAAAAVPAAAPAAPLFSWQQQRQVRLEDLHLSAQLRLEVRALPPLEPTPAAGGGASSAGTPGPLAEVGFATGASDGAFRSEIALQAGPLVLGAFGSGSGAAPPPMVPSKFDATARWQPPGPPGGATCLVGAFDSPQGPFGGRPPQPPLHKLPDLTKLLRNNKLHFQITVALPK